MDKITIPKIIHQIWIGPSNPPTEYLNTWKNNYIKNNPEYKYYYWKNNNIKQVLQRFPKLKMLYDIEKTWYGKADILRYMILYIYGGIYIDADCVWINNKSLDPLIDESKVTHFFAGLIPNKTYIVNGVIGCSKNNINILYVLNKLRQYTIKEYIKIRKTTAAHIITGPQLLNQIRYNIPNNKITVFPDYYFYPISWFNIKDKKYHENNNINKNSYMFHYGISTNNLSF